MKLDSKTPGYGQALIYEAQEVIRKYGLVIARYPPDRVHRLEIVPSKPHGCIVIKITAEHHIGAEKGFKVAFATAHD